MEVSLEDTVPLQWQMSWIWKDKLRNRLEELAGVHSHEFGTFPKIKKMLYIFSMYSVCAH
jgi:hypothetical protein